MQRTLAIIKPDAVAGRSVGRILARVDEEGFRIVALRGVHLTRAQAEGFYAVHRGKPFFGDLTAFMSSGPSVVMVLAGPDAIARWRAVMGATDPAQAEAGTLRKLCGTNIERNACHGSDALATATNEISFFFSGLDLVGA